MNHSSILSNSLFKAAGLLALLLALDAGKAAHGAGGAILVEAQTAPGKAWTNYPTRTLDLLPNPPAVIPASELNAYGGWTARKQKATGFFHPKKIGDRWWLVDPEGGLFLHKAVVAVSPLRIPSAEAAMKRKFGGESNWVERTSELLHENGFNGTGAWSDEGLFRQGSRPLVYTRIWNFMQNYGYKRGGVYQKPGHVGYPNDCIFIFDPEFETFCDNHAKQLAATKNDPWLLGHFSDNEMPVRRQALQNYLELPVTDPGHKAAWAWLRARHGANATVKDITEQDQKDFLAHVMERYYRIVSTAIKKYDPNHLFLGSRLHGGELNYPEVFQVAGRYLDVVAVNYYRTWTPSLEKLAMWAGESGRPILITEWYVKGEDSGMPNTNGAGWVVRTQRDRGRFYEHFTLGLLESKVVVGWHWFKYADNDPTNLAADPSNRDANKGIVSNRYEPYPELLDLMKRLNDRAYSLTDYFDRPAVQ